MCIPFRKKRQNQQAAAKVLPPTKMDEVKLSCGLVEPAPQPKEVLQSIQPKLLRVELEGAENSAGPNGRPWAVVSNACVFTVKAITEPPNTPVTWTGGQNPASNQVEISRTQIENNYIVTASLEGSADQSVAVDVFDLVSITRPTPEVFLDDTGAWKTYECASKATVRATTSPNSDAVLQLLNWKEATAGFRGKDAQFDRTWPVPKASSLVEIRKAKVSLGSVCSKSLSQEIRVCRWPKLELVEVAFSTWPVANDGEVEIGNLFDRFWKQGRPQPATGLKTADCQSILCLHGGAKLELSARFKVKQAPTDSEKVKIEGKATVGGVAMVWSQEVTVNPGDAFVDFPAIVADKALKAGVAAGSQLQIKWTQSAPPVLYANGTTDAPSDIGTSENLFYVILDPPQVADTEMYWTLLHISCKAANGKVDEDGFVPAAFGAFKTTTGDGNGIKRKGDGVALSYYLQGTNTRGGKPFPDVYGTFGILNSADGTGRCGGWMRVLIHTFEMHGVTSAVAYACVRKTSSGKEDTRLRFLVKNCSFPAKTNPAAAPYRNLGSELIKPDGVAGQGKTNPQFDFGDHVTVRHKGQIYDPSYGIGPYASAADYEAAAIGGFGDQTAGAYNRTLADGTPQFVSEKVGPECLFDYTSVLNDSLDSIAAKPEYACSVADLKRLNPALAGLAGNAIIPTGTAVIVPLSRSRAVLEWS